MGGSPARDAQEDHVLRKQEQNKGQDLSILCSKMMPLDTEAQTLQSGSDTTQLCAFQHGA